MAAVASIVCWSIIALLSGHLGWPRRVLRLCGSSLCSTSGIFDNAAAVFIPRRPNGNPTDPGPRLARHEIRLFALPTAVVAIAAAILSMMGTLVLQFLQAEAWRWPQPWPLAH